MKTASAVVFGLVAVSFGLWWAFVRAPAPQQVCDHIIDVLVSEAEADGMSRESQALVIEQMTGQCIAHTLDKIQLRGRIKYAKYARCVLSHTTSGEIDRC